MRAVRSPRWRTRAAVVGLLAAPLVVLGTHPAGAHPLGNATVNHYDGLHLYADRITDTAVEDVAEIPTYQRKGAIDTDGNGALSDDEKSAYASRLCGRLAGAVSVVADGTRVPLRVTVSHYTERLGAVGLQAGRLECGLSGAVDLTSTSRLSFADDYDGQGIGWHEVTAVATGVSLKGSPFPATSISQELRKYPNDLLSSPLDVRSGTLSVAPGSGASTYALAKRLPVAGPAVRALNALATTFNRTVGARHLTVGVGLLAVLLSVLLGAGHAFLPGHGKTIMAAYLVGRRGRLRDVVTVGATVTLTHTLGVLVLGLAITTTASFAPTAAEQYLGVVSGLIVAAVGVGLLVSALRRRRRPVLGAAPMTAAMTAPVIEQAIEPAVEVGQELRPGVTTVVGAVLESGGPGRTALLTPTSPVPPDHPHDHPHDHSHDDDQDHAHDHHPHTGEMHRHRFGRAHSHTPPEGGFSKGGLVGLGVAGGLVPSPSALLVLLAATALGRTVFGVVLVIGYGLGMAAALSAAGLLLVKLRGRLDRLAGSGRLARADRLLAVLPVLTALLVLAVGAGLTLRALGGSV